MSATLEAAGGLGLQLDYQVDNPDTLRRVFGHYPSGVAAIAATVDGEPTVLISSSFMVGISMEPPLVTFAVQHTSQSWPRLHEASSLGVSLLAAHQEGLCRQLAGRDRDSRFENVTLAHQGDALLIEEAAVWMTCRVHKVVPAGDHDIVVLLVDSLASDPARDPLVFHGSAFRSLTSKEGS